MNQDILMAITCFIGFSFLGILAGIFTNLDFILNYFQNRRREKAFLMLSDEEIKNYNQFINDSCAEIKS